MEMSNKGLPAPHPAPASALISRWTCLECREVSWIWTKSQSFKISCSGRTILSPGRMPKLLSQTFKTWSKRMFRTLLLGDKSVRLVISLIKPWSGMFLSNKVRNSRIWRHLLLSWQLQLKQTLLSKWMTDFRVHIESRVPTWFEISTSRLTLFPKLLKFTNIVIMMEIVINDRFWSNNWQFNTK